MLSNLRDYLIFEVNREGWTEKNLLLERFYDRFEESLNTSASNYNNLDQSSEIQNIKNAQEEIEEQIQKLNALLLDARLGIDRSKLNEIEAQMEEKMLERE